MIEVEVKAKIDNFQDIEDKLNKIGANKSKKNFKKTYILIVQL